MVPKECGRHSGDLVIRHNFFVLEIVSAAPLTAPTEIVATENLSSEGGISLLWNSASALLPVQKNMSRQGRE